MSLKHYLDILDDIYEADPPGQWSGHRAAQVVGEVSQLMAAAGHAHLVRVPVDDVDVIDAKRYVSTCIAATRTTDPSEGPYSVIQAAEQLGVSKETVYREVSEGLMPHTRIKSRITITAEQLAEYRRRKAATMPAQPGSFRHLEPR